MRYRAFISYCHADRRWAAWLHRSLERFRVPRRLAGTEGRYGSVPARLSPVFRDREDLSSASSLSDTIKEALEHSAALVVICSPAAAQSAWVNEEIRYFQALGRGDRVYSMIVDGDPQASESERRCFPEALLAGDAAEPLAADARRGADGKRLARLKLVAGILGLGLDELRRRELHRRRRTQAAAAVLVLAAAALLATTYLSYRAEQAARLSREEQQRSAEEMLSEFLEQAEHLSDVADLETRKAFDNVLSRYLADMRPADLTAESRRQLGVVLSNRGIILREEGEWEEAMRVFERAREVLQSLVKESNGDENAVFELSQVEFWIGQVNLDLGKMDAAEDSFRAYAESSDELYRMQPGNADRVIEVAYAQSNLGALENRRIPFDPQRVLQHYLAALEFNEMAASLNETYSAELADSHADVADAWLGVCELRKARDHRRKNVDLAEEFYLRNPVSNRRKLDYAYALAGLSRIQANEGRIDQAIETLQRSIDLQQGLVAEDVNNSKKRWNLLIYSSLLAEFKQLAGQELASRELRLQLESQMKEMSKTDREIRIAYEVAYGALVRDRAHQAYHRGDPVEGGRRMERSLEMLLEIAGDHPGSKRALEELAFAFFHYWEHNRAGFPAETAIEWLERITAASNQSSCSELDIASRLAVMQGDTELALTYAERLLSRGYRPPDYLEFCLAYALCQVPQATPGRLPPSRW